MTPLVRKRLRQVEVLHHQQEDGTQELIFSSRPFVLCGLPLRRPAKGTLLHTRRNGKFVLQVQAHPAFGLPFGQDRLIPIWVATLAVRQQSRSVRFRSATEILEEFGLPRNGKHYHRLIDGFKRVFTSTIYFGTDQQVSEQAIWEFSRFAFFDHMRLWYMKKQVSGEPTPTDNIITLSEQFWDEVREHPIPADLNVVRALANAPGCLDLYLWLVWRCFKLKREAQIPLFDTTVSVASSALMITFAGGICAELFCVGCMLSRSFGQTARPRLEMTEHRSSYGLLAPSIPVPSCILAPKSPNK
jgi:hypothetical protein